MRKKLTMHEPVAAMPGSFHIVEVVVTCSGEVALEGAAKWCGAQSLRVLILECYMTAE